MEKRFNLYLDIYEGFDCQYACAYSNPGQEIPKGWRRVKIPVILPDDAMEFIKADFKTEEVTAVEAK
jgi:hypothetical protein